ncbi:MAG: NUDIX hydrolase [Spirochaetia bacterium]|nr:NUDIX hydrolase [Spirochaetia bacterium]
MVAGDGRGGDRWETLSTQMMYSGSVFSVHEKTSQAPDGRQGRFSLIKSRDWAVVVPILGRGAEAKLLMVRQYRHGSDNPSLEFPGGVVETEEAPEKAAARELAEETGYLPGTLLHAGTVYPNPAIQGNRYHVFVALDPYPAVERNLDEHEIVDADLYPAAEILNSMGEGELSHALMCTALFLAEKCLARKGLPGLGRS